MVDVTMKCLYYNIDPVNIPTKRQLKNCLGMLYYSGRFKGIIIKIAGVSNEILFFELLTPNLKIEKRSTPIELLEIKEL